MSVPLLFWDVDTQVDFMLPDGKLYVPGAEERAANLARLTEAARRHRIPVIASADDHRATDEEISDDPDGATTFPPHCMHATPGAARIPETARQATIELGADPVAKSTLAARLAQVQEPVLLLTKNQLDVFSNPNTETALELLDPEKIVLYGVATDFCNRRAIEGLLERGYGGRLAMVEDAVQAIDPSAIPALLADWRERGLETITTDEAVALATAHRP